LKLLCFLTGVKGTPVAIQWATDTKCLNVYNKE
jgi:hypothetical protein